MTIEEEVAAQLKNKVIKWLAIALVAVVSIGSIGFYIYKDHRDTEVRSANNKLADLIPLQAVNDSLHYKIASMVPAEEIQKHIEKESQLQKTIKGQDERILALVSSRTETNVPAFVVPIVRTVQASGLFAKHDPWFDISGWLDSIGIHFETFRTWDSLTFAFTQTREGFIKGYVANHNPYNIVKNADFMIDSKQYYAPPWFRFDGFGVVVALGTSSSYVGVDARAVFWDKFELSPRFVSDGKAFNKLIEGRWRLSFF
jgi:hypothetical protein